MWCDVLLLVTVYLLAGAEDEGLSRCEANGDVCFGKSDFLKALG